MTDTPRKHERIRAQLLDAISALRPRDPLPPERELAMTFGVSRMTIRQAISSLVHSGHVYRVQGAGTYVADPTISKSLELTGFTEDMVARGLTPSSVVLAAEERPAGAAIGAALVLSPTEAVVHINRLRLADGKPMALETVHLPARLVPGIIHENLDGSLYDLLLNRYGVHLVDAQQTIRPTVLDAAEAELLGVPPLSPALVVERIGRDRGGHPIERAVSVYRGDRYDIRLVIRRAE